MVFMAMFYASAPLASIAAEGIVLTPIRRAYLNSAQSTGDRPGLSRRGVVVGGTAAVAAVAAIATASALTVNSPSDTTPFSGQSDLPQIGSVVGSQPAPSPSPTTSPTPGTSPSPVTSPQSTPSPPATSTPVPATPSPAGTPAPTP
jgi:hypothetical protein